MTKLKLGLVGCGAIGEIRARAALQSASVRLAAVTDADRERGRRFADRFNVAFEAEWSALLARKDIDAVVVSTPPNSHREIATAALESGKHVLCEKPLGRTPDECLAMIDAARRAGRALATGFNYRFYPSVEKAREIFDSGAIGELCYARGVSGYSAATHHQAWLHDFEVMGGGTMRDNGIHLIDTVCYFFGDPVEVRGAALFEAWKFPGCEDNGFVLMRNAKGNLASLHSSWTEWSGYKFQVELGGTRGIIRLQCFPMVLEISTGGVGNAKGSRKTSYFPWVHVMEHVKSYRWVVEQSFLREYDEFFAMIEGKPSRVASGHDGWRAVHIAECARSNRL
jgi:predicted dehydrogenase